MTATAPPAAPTDIRPPRLWRRHRATLLIVVAFAIALALAVWSAGSPETRADLEPGNPDPNGAKALAQVLDGEGVDVDVARGLEAFEDAAVPPQATVVITSTQFLSRDVMTRVREHAGRARIVLVGPEQAVLDVLALGVDQAPPGNDGDDAWPAGCRDSLMEGLTLEVDRISAFTADGCFSTGPDAAALVERDGLTLVGAPLALANDQILRGDNAAFGLRLLGQSDRLVWYVPSGTDATAGEGATLTSLLPRFVLPGLFLLALVMVAVVLWRGRRLGPLATEPLPVSVKAIETTLSRGRLYRRAGDRAHAASRLRAAARHRLAERVHGRVSDDESSLVRDLAQHLGRPESELSDLLRSDAPAPATDRDLIALAGTLAELEEEVRRR